MKHYYIYKVTRELVGVVNAESEEEAKEKAISSSSINSILLKLITTKNISTNKWILEAVEVK